MAYYEEGDLKVFNPQKDISREITLEVLIRHRDALKQARTGELLGVDVNKISDNQRKLNQVRALNLIISAQREMITISRPIIFFRSQFKWKKSYKDEEEQKKNPFDTFDCDYKSMLEYLDFLKFCSQQIVTAEKTRNKNDDFLVSKQGEDGEVYELTPNFYDMLEDLEETYEKVYLLMLTNKIVSAGIEEDEELTYKEQENEAISRIVEA